MAQQIQKQLINPVPQGGAPVFADDLLRVQENSKNSIVSFYEGLTRGGFRFSRQSASGQTIYGTTPGLYMNIPTYELISNDLYTVGEFFCMLDGEICYYPGGNIQFSIFGTSRTAYAVIKGAELKESRVFKDGVNREMLVTHTVEFYACSLGAPGWSWPSEVDGKMAVSLDALYSNDDVTEFDSYVFHPNSFLNGSGLASTVNRSLRNEADLTITQTNISTFTNGASASNSCSFYRDGNRFVQARGNITLSKTPTGTALEIFTLPSELVPASRSLNFICGHEDNGAPLRMEIQPTGKVVVFKLDGTIGDVDGNIYLDGVSYYEAGF
jgi:hypothetical protein